MSDCHIIKIDDDITINYRKWTDIQAELEQQSSVSKKDNILHLSRKSDLVSKAYEGGFKVWECSIDLCRFLAAHKSVSLSGKNVLEVKVVIFVIQWVVRKRVAHLKLIGPSRAIS